MLNIELENIHRVPKSKYHYFGIVTFGLFNDRNYETKSEQDYYLEKVALKSKNRAITEV